MQHFRTAASWLVCIVTTAHFCTSPDTERIVIDTPEKLYDNLFHDVQMNDQVFRDSKTFPDCQPTRSPEQIRKRYAELEDKSTVALKRFISDNFTIPSSAPAFTADSLPIDDHITCLWKFLKRPADRPASGTLIPLPFPYIVPGGRFREIYYWDSYFTMLGLREDSLVATIRHMVDNFASLIDTCGFIPNGNRTYYLSRSQPPFFSLMVAVLASCNDDPIYLEYREPLEKEYRFWMNGADRLTAGNPAFRRVVLLENGAVVNRYRDDVATPRPESYREDLATAEQALRNTPSLSRENVYRNLRSAAESGWDFSSRWLSPDSSGTFHLYTIHTTDIIPVDLNALLYHLEQTLARAHDLSGDSSSASRYRSLAEKRRNALDTYCWNDSANIFMDFNFRTKKPTGIVSLAGIYPLFFELASAEQANRTAGTVRQRFLEPGGVVTTVYNTGQQWDMPNGWAPLQWLTIKGLRNYGITGLADTISGRWCALNRKVYNTTYRMMEKYNVVDTTKRSGGGEYPTQDGFGWTNGVYKALNGNKLK
ncbi:MAG: alpha,alpha-trehalase TreF [Chitinispirillaceae bacterium]|nr:alpha,alpha-trehalase TreF [Chitinispirillaceae bacterium]